ncbi:MAG: NF038122 family metalloprotease [Synechococcales bacterium]|nr:NF038122 family metalloprotease [Synechococcales bacterium]
MFLPQIENATRRPISRWSLGGVTGLSSSLLVLGSVGIDSVNQPAQAISFNFSAPANTPSEVLAGFSAAGELWSSVLHDDVTVNIDVAFADLETGVLGRTTANEQSFAYTSVRDALWGDRTSTIDNQVAQQIPQGNSFNLLINYTSNSPFGSGSATPYLDNNGSSNNQTIRMTQANAKALGLGTFDPSTPDASILMNQRTRWDFDRSDGIRSDAFDFTTVAAHELGHALGFISGTDLLDTSSPFTVGTQTFYLPEDFFAAVSPLDLFRVSEASAARGRNVIDWTAGPSPKSFSLDGGQTLLAPFATGIVHGAGESNSHWAKDQTNGIMDPDIRAGEQLAITSLDLVALDAIGWNVRNPEVNLVGVQGEASQFIVSGEAANGIVPVPGGETTAAIGSPATPVLTPLDISPIEPPFEIWGTPALPAGGSTSISGSTAPGAIAPPLLPAFPDDAIYLERYPTPSVAYLNMTQAVPERSSWLAFLPLLGILMLRSLRRQQH